MGKKNELNFEEAIGSLEEIASNIENNRYGIDELLQKVKEAVQLINACKKKLNSTNDEVKKILANLEDNGE
ncbi:MAG: exodeoxyribonuclease VII small subunit [Bacteroidales bacterium]|nr:exodeoxyribonuclease VII small subunit [Bacteroidales bacterium]